MTTQEKNKAIAEWLGYETQEVNYSGSNIPMENRISEGLYIKKGDIYISCDFINNRNQQKLIEDKLIKDGWDIMYNYHISIGEWEIFLDNHNGKYFGRQNKSRDIAFIDAVIELIKQK